MTDVIFLHLPGALSPYRSPDQLTGVDSLPMGVLGLADLLQRSGISSEIVHLGVEWTEDPTFSWVSYLKDKSPRMVALDLHWHHQSFDVMEAARQVKAVLPQTYVLLGGLTASFFHEEIMKDFPSVDGIIRGEAEAPLVELGSALLQQKGDFFSIPNLTWRRKGKILINPLSYVASEEDLQSLSFANFSLLRNHSKYIQHEALVSRAGKIAGKRTAEKERMELPVFHLAVGRGCPVQCTWCSGGILAQRTISGRKEVIFRKIDDVLQTIREAISHGYEVFQICFDPYPQRHEYFLELFSRIREEKLPMECRFEAFGLPTIALIKSFKETFPGSKSFIILKPHVGSEHVRGIHKGYAFANHTLMVCLEQLNRFRIPCHLYFTTGVPFETEEDMSETIRFQKEIQHRYSMVKKIHHVTFEIEPGSPWHLYPEAYGVQTSLKTFMDYYHHSSERKDGPPSLGYWIPNYFRGAGTAKDFETALHHAKTRHFGLACSETKRPLDLAQRRSFYDFPGLFGRVKGLVGKKD